MPAEETVARGEDVRKFAEWPHDRAAQANRERLNCRRCGKPLYSSKSRTGGLCGLCANGRASI